MGQSDDGAQYVSNLPLVRNLTRMGHSTTLEKLDEDNYTKGVSTKLGII